MYYMGSKRKYVKYIVPILENYIKENQIEYFYDIFCGSCNLCDKITNAKVIANDLSPTLIALHKKLQSNPEEIPIEGNREWWDRAKAEYKKLMNFPIEEWEEETTIPLWEIGAIEWYNSFSACGFGGGFIAKSHNKSRYAETYKNHQKQAAQDTYKKINFINLDYRNIKFKENSLIYCDPPYKNTYPYTINPNFNHKEFYDWCKKTSKDYPIFISEQEMPNDFKIIWSKEDVTRTVGMDNTYPACEKLFFIGPEK